MKASHLLLRTLLSVVIVTAAAAQPVREQLRRPDFYLYTVVFGITVDEHGKITRFHVAGVTDAKSDSTAKLPIKVPEAFIAGARKKAEAKHHKPTLKNGRSAEFFIYYFYTPAYPNAVISDLYQPPDKQP